jgi:large subunit ribosomal protein L9
MKVLLLRDVKRLGKQGEVVTVRDGYGRNYLIPKRMACLPHAGAEKELELVRRKEQRIERDLITKAEEIKEAIDAIPEITLELRANEEGHLFGSVTPTMVSEALRDLRLKVDAKQVEIAEPIKAVGEATVVVNIYKDVTTELKINVKATDEVKTETDETEETEEAPPETPTEEPGTP